MPPSARAVVFDLDDTLYPVRHFHLSAFKAVGAYLRRSHGIDAGHVQWFLTRAYDSPLRGREFQALLQEWKLPETLLPMLIEVSRSHLPALALPVVSSRALAALRPAWRLAILTNGIESVQVHKVQALHVDDHVDRILYASAHGSGRGKPDPGAFEAVLDALEVPPRHAVFVGDSETSDIQGAKAVGLHTVRLTAWTGPCRGSEADAVIASLADLPALAEALVQEDVISHVA